MFADFAIVTIKWGAGAGTAHVKFSAEDLSHVLSEAGNKEVRANSFDSQPLTPLPSTRCMPLEDKDLSLVSTASYMLAIAPAYWRPQTQTYTHTSIHAFYTKNRPQVVKSPHS